MPKNVTCKEDKCNKPVKGLGFCNSHYATYWRARQSQCSVEGCVRPVRGRGFCQGHYKMDREGKPITPIRDYKFHLGTTCYLDCCNSPAEKQGFCNKHYTVRWNHPDLSLPMLSKLMSETRCRICQQEKPLHIDHNHAICPGKEVCDRCVRGMLCRSCNIGLGFFQDRVDIMQKAILYLGAS